MLETLSIFKIRHLISQQDLTIINLSSQAGNWLSARSLEREISVPNDGNSYILPRNYYPYFILALKFELQADASLIVILYEHPLVSSLNSPF